MATAVTLVADLARPQSCGNRCFDGSVTSCLETMRGTYSGVSPGIVISPMMSLQRGRKHVSRMTDLRTARSLHLLKPTCSGRSGVWRHATSASEWSSAPVSLEKPVSQQQLSLRKSAFLQHVGRETVDSSCGPIRLNRRDAGAHEQPG